MLSIKKITLFTLIISSHVFGGAIIETMSSLGTPEFNTILNALGKANTEIMQQDKELHILKSVRKLMALLERNHTTTVIPELNPGAMNLVIKCTMRDIGTYLKRVSRHLDASSAARCKNFLERFQAFSLDLENYVKTRNAATKAAVCATAASCIQTLLDFMDISRATTDLIEDLDIPNTTVTDSLVLLNEFNALMPTIIAEFKAGILASEGNKIEVELLPVDMLIKKSLLNFLTPQGLALASAFNAIANDYEPILEEYIDGCLTQYETAITHNEHDFVHPYDQITPIVRKSLPYLPPVAYDLGSYFSHEQSLIVVELLEHLHIVTTTIQAYATSRNEGDRAIMLATISALVELFAKHILDLPPLPERAGIFLENVNRRFPQLVNSFKHAIQNTNAV